jgi:hypothetical protein
MSVRSVSKHLSSDISGIIYTDTFYVIFQGMVLSFDVVCPKDQ